MTKAAGQPDVQMTAVGDAAPLDPAGVLTALGSTVYDWDVLGERILWGANAATLLGLRDSARIEKAGEYRKMISGRSIASRDDVVADPVEADHGSGVPFALRYELVLPSGILPVEDSGRWFAGPDGRPARVKGVLRLLTDAVIAGDAEAPTAGARADLLRRIETAMTASRKSGRPFALLVVSIGGLSSVDRDHGSEICDLLVSAVAGRLARALRRTDSLIRYSTAKIGVVLARCTEADIGQAAERLNEAACLEPIEVDDSLFPVTLAIGGVTDPEGARDGRSILRRCEEAMHKAQRSGASFHLYKPDRKQDALRQSDKAATDAVLHALNERRILLAYQPIVAAKTGAIAFHEGLVRLRRTDGEIVSAGSIVPVFERMGRVHLIDHRVLELGLQALAADADLRLSINVSTTTLLDRAWMQMLASALVGRADIPDRLIVELTESQAIENVTATREIFAALKGMGVRTAIDDFGAGYTSFKHLRGLDVDLLKIDGAFVQNIGRSGDDSFFVRTLIDLAQHLGIETVAEWVTDEDAARKLTAWGVTYLQGDSIAPAAVPGGDQKRRILAA
ncbi:MAG: EAL domain-containing protein [Beijerinckiaceae bacterium]